MIIDDSNYNSVTDAQWLTVTDTAAGEWFLAVFISRIRSRNRVRGRRYRKYLY